MSSMKFSELPIGMPFRFAKDVRDDIRVFVKLPCDSTCTFPGYLEDFYDTPEGLTTGPVQLCFDCKIEPVKCNLHPHSFIGLTDWQMVMLHGEMKDSSKWSEGDMALVVHDLRKRGLVERVVTYRIKDLPCPTT